MNYDFSEKEIAIIRTALYSSLNELNLQQEFLETAQDDEAEVVGNMLEEVIMVYKKVGGEY